ncbi:hypothetical protein TREVI0001_2409 [Treponema vincentii ATCC 35580]|uniref:Uncharacterized protein n=1 Tax=Treponema vincentii ATCC 35580 TaxID=596324 RepID=C8PNL3_9SPIR|nr:hypothetical protein TREVI0001_2409 [Treponema vincentii ATCC 35580]
MQHICVVASQKTVLDVQQVRLRGFLYAPSIYTAYFQKELDTPAIGGIIFTAYSLQLTAYSLQLTAYSLQLTAYSLQLTARTLFR